MTPRSISWIALACLVAGMVGVLLLHAVDDSSDGSYWPRISEAAVSPDGRSIVVAVGGHDGYGLVVVDAAGVRPQRELTDGSAFDSSPRWSPDGRSILFLRTDEHWANGVLMTVGRDGRNLQTLAPAPSMDAVWSPDGRWIAAVLEGKDGRGQLTLLAPRGGAPRSLARSRDALGPTWSPDGRQIAFQSGHATDDEYSDAADVYVVRASGGEPQRITATRDVGESLSWSPTGKHLAFVRTWYASERLHLHDFATGRDEQLSKADQLEPWATPTWSPDGSLVAVGGWDGVLVGGPGEKLRPIDRRPTGGDLHWSQDGGHVAHETCHGGWSSEVPADVVVSAVDDHERDLNVTNTPGRDESLVGWLADGRHLAVVRESRALLIVGLDHSVRRLAVLDPGSRREHGA